MCAGGQFEGSRLHTAEAGEVVTGAYAGCVALRAMYIDFITDMGRNLE